MARTQWGTWWIGRRGAGFRGFGVGSGNWLGFGAEVRWGIRPDLTTKLASATAYIIRGADLRAGLNILKGQVILWYAQAKNNTQAKPSISLVFLWLGLL
jgi:hypothetical protein